MERLVNLPIEFVLMIPIAVFYAGLVIVDMVRVWRGGYSVFTPPICIHLDMMMVQQRAIMSAMKAKRP